MDSSEWTWTAHVSRHLFLSFVERDMSGCLMWISLDFRLPLWSTECKSEKAFQNATNSSLADREWERQRGSDEATVHAQIRTHSRDDKTQVGTINKINDKLCRLLLVSVSWFLFVRVCGNVCLNDQHVKSSTKWPTTKTSREKEKFFAVRENPFENAKCQFSLEHFHLEQIILNGFMRISYNWQNNIR